MKKFLAILLAAMLVLSMTAVAFADTTYTDSDPVLITKEYVLIGAGSSPDENFQLEVISSTVADGDANS
ncbi:MAG: hypothetical protein ACI4MK_08220, partial [Aristaeellaceae bacterium]